MRVARERAGLGFTIEHYVVAKDRSFPARCARLALGLLEGVRRAHSTLADRRPAWQAAMAFAIARLARFRPRRPTMEQAARNGYPRAIFAGLMAVLSIGMVVQPSDRPQDADGPVVSSDIAGIALEAPAHETAAQEAARPASDKPETPGPAAPPQERPWQDLRQPIALYHLESPELAGLTLDYRAARRDQARRDTMVWQPRAGAGESEPRRSTALLTIERESGVQPGEKPLFADLAARAAEHRLVLERMARPEPMRTKFGMIETTELLMRHESDTLPCLAFRLQAELGLAITGWLCGTAQRPVDRVAMGCFIDRLDLVGGARDQALRKFFVEAERARQNCASARQPGRRMTWLDHESPVPSLKLTARR